MCGSTGSRCASLALAPLPLISHTNLKSPCAEQLGTRHINGFTSFWHRIDNSSAKFGDGDADRNVLAVFANSAPGSGMYGYHGGGLTRHQFLVHTSSDLFIPPDSAWVHTSLGSNSSVSAVGSTPADGLAATGVTFVAEGTVSNAGAQLAQRDVWVAAEFMADDGPSSPVVATQAAGPFTIPANGSVAFEIRVSPRGAVQLWSVARPALHTARITVHVGGPGSSGPGTFSQTYGSILTVILHILMTYRVVASGRSRR